ncbi:MAG TPA: sulfurtransferase [Myxococcales bacterium]|nr:sulfurtransferase [Myxococcales bacterium]
MSDIPLLVDPRWVQSHPEARLVDLRWTAKGPSARQKYEEGHLPGAVFVDLDEDLARPGGPGRHPFPGEEQFARVLSRLGIGAETPVVVYDDGHSSFAARFWFMLRAFGHRLAAVLDGGLRAWTEAGLPLSREEPRIAAAPIRKLVLDRARLADVTEVQARKAVVLDARAPERYRGEVEPLDRKAGHIPGALNAPWAANLTAAQRFRPPQELRQLYEKYGSNVIVSCGSGVTACHDALAMEVAGLPPPRLYVGSFSGWIEDPARPIATGPEPG